MATTTTDHDSIRDWVEQRGGQPARLRRIPEVGANDGDLGIEFLVDGQEPELVTISWADFFQRFEDHKLAFAYEDDDTATGEPNWRIVPRSQAQK